MAIDYGSKRCGIAVTDPLQIIANALTTVHSKDLLHFLTDYCQKEPIDVFVVGEPRHLNGKPTDATELTNRFVKQLQKQFPSIPVERIDERYTSKIAFQSMIDSGLKKKDRQNKSTVDEVSAVLLLQSYMEKR